MARPLLSLATLLLPLAVSLVSAQTTPPVVPPAAPKAIVQQATAFAEKYLLLPASLLADVGCYPDPGPGGVAYACTAPVNPGITTSLTDFLCTANGCFRFLGSVPTPCTTPGPSTPTK